MARKLAPLILDAQGEGELKFARNEAMQPDGGLSGDVVRFLSHCGTVKAAVDAGMRARAVR